MPPTGGGGDQSTEDRPHDPCEDRQADTLAELLNAELNEKADKDRIEYGALIYRDENGDLQHSDLIPGENGLWTGMEGTTPEDFGMTSWSQVVGIFHHHPTEVYLESVNQWVDVTQSACSDSNFDLPSSGDWATVFSFINDNSASLNNFTIYVSFNGSIKEFDAIDNQLESRDPNDGRGGHGVESEDYDPGESCP